MGAKRRFTPVLLASVLALLSLPAISWSQSRDLVKAYDEAVAAMESGQLEEGLAIVEPVIADNADGALKRYGPAFGHFYYLRGMLLIRQKKYEAAIDPLKTCYEVYTNEGKAQGLPPNLFQIHALMQWGACLQALERYEEAAQRFERTLEEDPKKEPRINRLSVQVNLARCYIRSGKKEEGEKMLSAVLNLEGLSSEEIQDAFTIMAADGVAGGDGGPGIMDIVSQHSQSLFGSEDNRAVMNPRLASLGAQALKKGEPLQALVWFNLMTSPYQTIQAQEQRKAQLLQRRELEQATTKNAKVIERIDEIVAGIDDEVAELNQLQANSYLGMAAAHLSTGSLTAARALYQKLYDHYPGHSERAVIIHNLVICESQLERWDQAFLYGEKFFNDYPSHELRPTIARILAEVVFQRGDFQLASEMALEARTDVPAGDPRREGLDFVVAASLYQLGRLDQADQELGNFIADFPNSPRLETVRFYQCVTKVSLGDWREAAPKLEGFIKDYPQSQVRPTVLFMSASAHLVLEEYNLSLARVNSLITLFPNAREIARAHNLRGDVLGALERENEEVAAAYLAGRDAAEKEGAKSAEVAAYAQRQLIRTASSAGDYEQALQYFEEFQAKYPNSKEMPDAAVASLNAYVALRRTDEGRKMLEDLVLKAAAENSEDFELIFGSYTDFLMAEYTAADAQAALAKFADTGASGNPGVTSAIIIGQIEALEAAAGEEPDQNAIDAQYAKLNKLYQEKGGHQFSGTVLVRLARWLSDQGKVAQSKEIYALVEKGKSDGPALGYVLIDTAKLDLASGDPQRMEAARQKFERVLNEVEEGQLQEEAVLGLGRVAMRKEQWSEAERYWLMYLGQQSWMLARPEANYSYGLALDKQKKVAEALKVYVSVYANFSGHVDWSIPACIRAAEILKESGQELKALQVLQDMLRRTKNLEHPNIDRAKEVFFEWRDEYTEKQK